MGKNYIYYQRIAIKEGLDTESEKLHLDMFDKDLSRCCWGCRQVFIIKKPLTLTLQYVQKIMHREDVVLDESGEIHVDKYLNYYE